MPAFWNQESGDAKEKARWDRKKRDGGMNANGHEEYPKMLYMARTHEFSAGKYVVAVQHDILTIDKTRVLFDAEQFTRTCQLLVNSEAEEAAARGDGWRGSAAEALKRVEERELEMQTAAAERAYSDRNMSLNAKAEADAADRAHDGHMPEVKVKRAYRRKSVPAPAA